LSWAIEFVDFSEAREGSALNTISEFELNLNPNSVTSVDYFKQESRLCTIKFFKDSWIDSELGLFINGTGNILDVYSYWWKYVCRIKFNGATEYIGYLRRDGITVDNNKDMYMLKLYDISGVLFNLAKEFIWEILPVSNRVFRVDELLESNLNGLMGDSSGTNLIFDSYLINNYDITAGLQIDNIELYNKTGDLQLLAQVEDIDDWDWFVDDVIIITENIQSGVVAQHAVLYVEGGFTKVVLMKYKQELYQGGFSLLETIYVKTFTITNDVWLLDQVLAIQNTNQTFISVAGAVAYANALNLYNPYYVDLGYPVVNVFSLTVGNDNYDLIETANILNYSGFLNFFTVTMDTTKERTYESDIKMLLLMNNLALSIHNDGIIEIINKTITIGRSTVIDPADIISFKQSGIIKQVPDYGSINNGLIQKKQEITSNAERDFYEDLFESLTKEINVKIENNYDLILNQIIIISDDNYKVKSIHLDNDRFVYTIKAWGI